MKDAIGLLFLTIAGIIAGFIIGTVLASSAHAEDGIVKHRSKHKDYEEDQGDNVSVNLPPSIQKCHTDLECEQAAYRLCKRGKVEWCETSEEDAE